MAAEPSSSTSSTCITPTPHGAAARMPSAAGYNFGQSQCHQPLMTHPVHISKPLCRSPSATTKGSDPSLPSSTCITPTPHGAAARMPSAAGYNFGQSQCHQPLMTHPVQNSNPLCRSLSATMKGSDSSLPSSTCITPTPHGAMLSPYAISCGVRFRAESVPSAVNDSPSTYFITFHRELSATTRAQSHKPARTPHKSHYLQASVHPCHQTAPRMPSAIGYSQS